MYGHFNVILKAFVVERFGEETWKNCVKRSGCAAKYDEETVYDDNVSTKLTTAASAIIGIKSDVFLTMLGEFYLSYVRRIGHDELLRNLGENMLDFLDNLDYIHTYMMSNYPDMKMPSFRCAPESTAEQLTLHYYSFRQGYYFMVIGLLTAIAKTYFASDLRIEIISKTAEQVGDKKATREHVVFSLTVTKANYNAEDEGPPTFVAQTKKHGEKQILKSDIEHVIARLEEIKRTEGEDALPLNRKKALQAKWRAAAKIGSLLKGFQPRYPAELSVSVTIFCNAFPYHAVFNRQLEVIHSGSKLQQLMPTIRNAPAKAGLFFDLLHPHTVSFSFEQIIKFVNTPFVVKTKKAKMMQGWGSKPMLILRGQILYEENTDVIVYLCSPFVRCLNDLGQREMHIADIPIHDVTRDMLWMELMIRHGMFPDAKSDKTVAHKDNAPSGLVMVGAQNRDTGQGRNQDGGPEAAQDRLYRTEGELDAERRRTAWLYSAFLPPSTATQLLNGQQPDAGEYKSVTVLFCDVVAFTEIITNCKPNDVVNMLTQLHAKFDRICQVHATYRVEAIGDAYMVISGSPDELVTHAERVANTALGMMEDSKNLGSPYDYGDRSRSVKIRIGLNTGMVVGGVVGYRLPRFMVMGDTVNVASKMESHGVPGKIQISQSTHERLKGKGFTMVKRGDIEVRGRGKMTTFFLVKNDRVNLETLTGQKPQRNHNNIQVTFINDGRIEKPPRSSSTTGSRSPLLPRNRLHPTGSETPTPDYVPMQYKDSARQAALANATGSQRKGPYTGVTKTAHR